MPRCESALSPICPKQYKVFTTWKQIFIDEPNIEIDKSDSYYHSSWFREQLLILKSHLRCAAPAATPRHAGDITRRVSSNTQKAQTCRGKWVRFLIQDNLPTFNMTAKTNKQSIRKNTRAHTYARRVNRFTPFERLPARANLLCASRNSRNFGEPSAFKIPS